MTIESIELTDEEELALNEMEEAFKNKDLKVFVDLLSKNPSLLIRVHAACTLEGIGNEEVVPILTRILREDPSALTRHEAAFTLGQLGYQSAVNALVEAMERDPNPIVRHESAVALSSIGDPRAIPYLKRALHDTDEDVRNSAAISLKYLSYLHRRYGPRNSDRSKQRLRIRL